MVTLLADSFAFMVKASDKYDDFSKRFRKALQDAGVDSSSPTSLARVFGTRAGKRVTPQAARKWLNGEAIPSHEKLKALAQWLRVGTEWLRYGKDDGTAFAAQEPIPVYGPVLSDQELLKRYHRLSSLHKSAVAEIITVLAAKGSGRIKG